MNTNLNMQTMPIDRLKPATARGAPRRGGADARLQRDGVHLLRRSAGAADRAEGDDEKAGQNDADRRSGRRAGDL